MADLKETVLRYLASFFAVKPNEPLVVGCSGGADSLCLLHVLLSISQKIIVAHFNHRLRPEADEEAEYVKTIADRMKLPIVLESGDVRAFSIREKRGIEEAARMMRYQFLFKLAREVNAQAVAVGHHDDDQVETVLIHFLRGAGSIGLRGMLPIQHSDPWDNTIPLIRPLLTVWKKDILSYCEENHLQPLYDASNADLTYLRNRLRHVLIPHLEREYNAQIKPCLWQTAQVLAVETAFIEEETDRAWRECIVSATNAETIMIPQRFDALHLAIKRSLLRRVLWKLLPEVRDIDYECVQQAVDFFTRCLMLQPKRSRSMHLFKDVVLSFEKSIPSEVSKGDDIFVIARSKMEALPEDYEAQTLLYIQPSVFPKAPPIPYAVVIPSDSLLYGWRISLREQDVLLSKEIFEEIRFNANKLEAFLDLDLLEKECLMITLRRRRAGDRFQPLGMPSGSIKLSDYMINTKIPRRLRDEWLLFSCKDNILWVAGYQIAHPFRVKETTKRVLHIKLEKQDD